MKGDSTSLHVLKPTVLRLRLSHYREITASFPYLEPKLLSVAFALEG